MKSRLKVIISFFKLWVESHCPVPLVFCGVTPEPGAKSETVDQPSGDRLAEEVTVRSCKEAVILPGTKKVLTCWSVVEAARGPGEGKLLTWTHLLSRDGFP